VTKSRVAAWRDAVRDSELTAAQKHVALTLSTYMNGDAAAYPSVETLAQGCSYSDRTVQIAIQGLRAAGYLAFDDNKGGKAKTYVFVADVPQTAKEVHRIEFERANDVRGKRGQRVNVALQRVNLTL
jgi:helix-turn-helix protein